MAPKTKKVEKQVKLQLPAGKANPAPPVGTALGPLGINIGEFVQRFNAATAQMGNDIIPCVISVYADRSFDFILKTPPAANLIMKVVGIEKGSGKNTASKVGKITEAQAREIAEKKMVDLNTENLDAATKTIKGTARSMGVEVVK